MNRRRRLAIEALESRLVLDSVGLDVADAAGSPLERVIVQLNDDVADPQQAAEALIQPFQGRLGHVYQDALKGFSVELPAAAISALQRNPAVKLVEPDVLVHAAGQTVPSGVERIDAEPALFPDRTGNVDVDVAILDTGIFAGHEDLEGLVVGGKHFYSITTGPPSRRGQFQDDNYDDDNGHGTHVAGIVAAIDEYPGHWDSTVGWGYVGVAPGARLWAVKVLDSTGSGYVSDLVAGVDWVVEQGDIEVVNMSLTAGGYSAALRTAIRNGVNQGVVFVAAAGNEYQDVYGADGSFGNSDDIFPASFPEVATISALCDTDGQPGGLGPLSTSYGGADRNGDGFDDGLDDSFACFSNYSVWPSVNQQEDVDVVSAGNAIDLVMPGVDIWSTWTDGMWVQISGTSQAAPHAAGLAALYIAEHGAPTDAAGVYALRQALIDAGKDQDSGVRLTYLATEPDTAYENLGWAGPAHAHDVAVTAITAPGSVLAGETALIEVAVQNQGSYDETFDVILTSDNGTPENAEDDLTMDTWTAVALTPGTSTTLSTSWDTTDASLGDYTLTALAGPVSEEVDTADNSKSTVVTVESPVTDVAIAAVEASASVMQGDVAEVLVTVENAGNQDVFSDVGVTLRSDDVVIDTQTITGGLAAGGSTTLTFSWDTAGAELGDHTLTASHDFADDNAANDSNGTVVAVQEVGETMYVADLDAWAVSLSKNWWQANVTITVLNELEAPVAGATVTGVWSDGTITVSGLTDGSGQTTVTSATLHRRTTSTTFEVTAITHDTLTYEPNDNTDPDGDSDGTIITVYKDAAARAMLGADSDSLDAMCREIAWHYASQQQPRTRSGSQQDESTSPQVVDYLMAQDR